jgi:hypothetical protein
VELQGHQGQGQEVILAEEELQWEEWLFWLVGPAVLKFR